MLFHHLEKMIACFLSARSSIMFALFISQLHYSSELVIALS